MLSSDPYTGMEQWNNVIRPPKKYTPHTPILTGLNDCLRELNRTEWRDTNLFFSVKKKPNYYFIPITPTDSQIIHGNPFPLMVL